MGLLRSLIDSEYKELKKFEKKAKQIDALSEEMAALSDKELAAKTDEFKKELEEGKTLEDILVPAFAVVREAANLPISNPYAAVFLTLVAATMIVLHSIGECKLVSNYSIDKVDKVVGWLGTVMISLMPLVTNDNFDYKRHGKFLVKAGALLPGYFWVIAIVTIVITSIVYSCVYDCVDNLGFICAAIPVKGLNIIEQIVKAILHAGLILLQIFAPAVSFVISIAIAIAGVSLVRVLMRISFYYKEVYVNPVAHFIFRHNKEIPLVHKKLPRKIRKDYENIDLALPVFVLYGVRGVKKRGAIWLVIKGTDHRLIVKRRFKYEDMCISTSL